MEKEGEEGRVMNSYLSARVLSLNDVIPTDTGKLGVKVTKEWEVEMN